MSIETNQDFNLRPFTEDDFEGFLALKNLLYPYHRLSITSFRHCEKTRGEKIHHKHWVWEKDGTILCSALYTQWEEIYHPQKFVITIYVHPEKQGQGYGSSCYDYLIQEMKSLNPIKISASIHEPHAQSIRFFENRGFHNSIKECESSLDLTVYDPKLYENELDYVLQQGLRIVTFSKFRQENNKADYKAWEFERDVAPDMPWTDPITIPEFDAYNKRVLANPKFNPDSWFFVLDDSRIIGLNNLWKNEMIKGINTGLTGVRREYRRKGIATALKHTGLTWAKNQGYEWIRTDNVATNEGMLSINIRVGFKFMPAWLMFDKLLYEKK